MKTMTCKQLGGACDMKFSAETFDKIVEQSKNHGMEMFQKQDQQHLEAMQKIRELMSNPDEMTKWFEERKKEFNELPED